jgi:hypothetical protein
MKTLTLIIFILTISFSNGFTQNIDSVTHAQPPIEIPEIFENDNTLKLIAKELPKDWKITYQNDTLAFISIVNIFLLSDSILNNSNYKQKHRRNGNLIAENAYIFFYTEQLWSGYKVNEAISHNVIINQQIDNLGKRFKITHLIDSLNSPNFNIESDIYTNSEKKSLKKYLDEKKKLETELIRLPDFHLSTVSLFFNKIYPEKNISEKYVPTSIINEIDIIYSLIKNLAGK